MGYNTKPFLSNAPIYNQIPTVDERNKEINKIRKEAEAAHEQAQKHTKERIKGNINKYKEGDQVWINAEHLPIQYQNKKLSPKRIGLFKVLEAKGNGVYLLDLPKTWNNIHHVFNERKLTPYIETEEHGPNYLRPPPDLIEGEEEFEVEAIVNHRKHRNKPREFLIK